MPRKKIGQLLIPENDAENFIKADKKTIFNTLFVAKEHLDEVIDSSKYFLIGEKGTGKTAYAVYLSNNNYKETFSTVKYIRETEYAKFIEMKRSKNLQLSDYEAVWKVLLLLLVSQEIENVCRTTFLGSLKNLFAYQNIKKLIKEFTNNAFTPELLSVMNLIDNDEFIAKVKAGNAVGSASAELREVSTVKQTSIGAFNLTLMDIENKFKNAIKDIKIGKNYILFIDGIDIRPSSISQEDYIECLKGLTNAIWNINQDFFGKLKDRQGYTIKVMLLIRPDIFMKMDLQNQATKIHNNSIVLSWLTTYAKYRSSNLFALSDKILSYNQEQGSRNIGDYFDAYFPYKLFNKETNSRDDSPFIGFLRYSFYRARDIVTILSYMQKVSDEQALEFSEADFNSVLQNFSKYLWMEIRDYFKFYYKDEEFDFLRNFLILFNEKVTFNLDTFKGIYNGYIEDNSSMPMYAQTYSDFIQFLFELNIVGYVDYNNFGASRAHWCFRERDMSNPVPKINMSANEYRIHHGLHAALRIESGSSI